MVNDVIVWIKIDISSLQLSLYITYLVALLIATANYCGKLTFIQYYLQLLIKVAFLGRHRMPSAH